MPVQWSQNYAALDGSLLLTGLVVAIPIFFLFWALAVRRMKGHRGGHAHPADHHRHLHPGLPDAGGRGPFGRPAGDGDRASSPSAGSS